MSDYSTYTGWARVGSYQPAGYRPSAADVVCAQVYPSTCGQRYWPAQLDFSPSSVATWRWNGSAWSKSSVQNGQWVWVAPYATGWSWVWTQGTGWLAARDGHLFAPS